ncbi:MAG: (E)-4-hydroxy-3-methylbut-2-enyl-diphosphate synthase [Paludibacteraceae bacterium]|nr:(E)-4-hydroxy-3-methylbut-2-enyl-diphosphate synthase [Paludibacteraceae bacterium]
MWIPDLFNYNRRPTQEIKIGNLLMGGNTPIRLQSMTNTDTNDIDASVSQCIRLIKVGAELVRLTTQGLREVESLKKIHQQLNEKKFYVPLIADVHFNPLVAEAAARCVEKVRINPGNYVRSIKINHSADYTKEEFNLEQQKLKEQFIRLLNICKEHRTAIRIGVNHGSLSERMMNRYGDTSEGLVASCMEFLQICQEENFSDVVVSIKASNTVLMIHAVRKLVKEMEQKGFHYPIHLGVTEAGEGEDGRIKSAVGIGTLLADGIGDTIRVSLSEEPEAEIPVARQLVSYIAEREQHEKIFAQINPSWSPFEYSRRKTQAVANIGGNHLPVVFAATQKNFTISPDYYIEGRKIYNNAGKIFSVYLTDEIPLLKKDVSEVKFLKLSYPELNSDVLSFLKERKDVVILLFTKHKNGVAEQRAFFHTLMNKDITTPVIIARNYQENNLESLQIKASVDIGMLFVDGFGDGILLQNEGTISLKDINSLSFGILQATRVRISKTEYISCPGCGRTLFDLQKVVAEIKAKTSHLKGLKIAVMGCIVNGPGEMADADYGYVGTGKGKVSLYKGKQCLLKNIAEDEAINKLIELIKVNGDWL